MKKTFKRFLASLISVGCLGSASLAVSATNEEETFDPGEYAFIYELFEVVNEYAYTPGLQWWSIGCDYDKQVIENSRVELVVANQETADKFIAYVESQGYDSNLLDIEITTEWTVAPQIALMGDANSDGEVDIRDITTINNHIIGNKEIPFVVIPNADVNSDREVDVEDLTKLKMYILKLTDTLL